MRKLKHSEVKYRVQTHRATKKQRQVRNSGSLASEPELLTTTLFTMIQKAIFKEEDYSFTNWNPNHFSFELREFTHNFKDSKGSHLVMLQTFYIIT